MKSMRLPPASSASLGPPSRSSSPTTPPRAACDENDAASRLHVMTSACRLITQKPGPSGSGCLYTGALARRYVNHSCGIPCVKRSRSSRSMSSSSMPLLPRELWRALLDEGPRAFLCILAHEHPHAELRVDAHGLRFGHRLGGPQRPQHGLHGERDLAAQPHDRTAQRVEAPAHLGHPEAGALPGDADVGGLQDLGAPGHSRALHRRDERLVEEEPLEERL